jgi:hypothetical protein
MLGQGMFCDAVSVILVISSKVVNEKEIERQEEHLPTDFMHSIEMMVTDLPLSFTFVWGLSISIGLFFGVFGSYILKHVTSLTENTIA